MRASLIRGDYSHALETAGKAVEDPRLDHLEWSRVRLFKGMVKNWGGKSKEALQDMEESLRVFEGEYSLPDMTDMLVEIGTAYLGDGQLENAIAATLRSCALGEYARNLSRQEYARAMSCHVFNCSGLRKEALKAVAEAFEITEKISDPISRAWDQNFVYWHSGLLLEAEAADRLFSRLPLESMRNFGAGAKIKFFMSSLSSGALGEFKQGLKAAIVQSLKGAGYAEETDSFMAQANNYANLTRQYAELGDMEQAEKYHMKLVKIFDETSLSGYLLGYGAYLFSRAVFFSSKGQWKEANQFYEEALEAYTKVWPSMALDAGIRQSYCWALMQQGRLADAETQFEEAKKKMDSLEKRFVHSNILGYLVAPMRVEVSKEFNMRLDMVNVAKNPGLLVRVEGLAPAEFKVTATQPYYDMENGSIKMEKRSINPFQDLAITFTVQATKTGIFNLNPQLVYVDDLGETKTFKITPVNITVQLALE
jgi:tetratricopeptide (TPR) repeat protein